MHPILFKMGPVLIYTYGFLVALGMVLGISLALREARKAGYDPQPLMDMIFYVVLAGIVGSRMLYVAQNFSSYRANPLDVVKLWEGGLVFYGALLLGLPVGWYCMKKRGYRFWRLFDIFAPSIALGQALGRMGCFFAGCCYGRPTDLAWGVTFSHPQSLAPTGIPLHPTQLYASLALMAIFFVLLGMRRHIHFSGQMACVYLILHSVLRFSIEFLRADSRLFLWQDAISFTQVISIVIFLVGLGAYFWLSRNKSSRATK